MNFIQMNYLPFIMAAFVIFLVLVIILERHFFATVQKYWFFRRSLFSYASSFLLVLGFGTLLLSLLDARGREEKVKTPVPRDRTIILIDTSASMLAEDVRPSRLQKAVLLAKHFARKSTGHHISVVAFAEIQKKIVPFTTDLDLIDSRLDSIKNLRNQYGSSALSIAIQESIQYFLEADGEARGNILVLTDGEETAEGVKLKVPKDIHVALVGIGTAQGGRIPLDDGRGFRFGYKKHKGIDVITKLNESFFKKTVADIPSAKYWLANTYSLPSEEIVEFFNRQKQKTFDQQDMIIRPVKMEWLVVPALIMLMLSYLLKAVRVFTLGLLLIWAPIQAQETALTPELAERLQELSEGNLTRLERIKLADDLYKSGAKQEALALYDETMPLDQVDKEIPPEAYLNYGTALLQNKEPLKGLAVYDTLNRALPKNDEKAKELREIMDKNMVTYFRQVEQRKQQKKQQDKEKKDQEESEQQGKTGEGEEQFRPDKEGQWKKQQKKSGKEKNEKDKQGEDQEKEKKEKEKGKGKEDQDPKEGEDDQKQDPQELTQGEQKRMPPKKLEPKLKQLLSDDRQLQLQMIERGTRDLNKRQDRKSKDW